MKKLFITGLLLGSIFNLNAQSVIAPRIVVGIVIDQMCYDYLYRFNHVFTTGGFNRLMSKGTNCRNTQYNYVPTYTAPGHASIYTGTTPSNHGIVGNDWYNRSRKMPFTSVHDERYNTIGSATGGQTSPMNLLTYTITDQLKMAWPQSKVISISIKDRGAILPGGHLSDGTYWYDYTSGDFVTSSFYGKDQLPPWIESFNSRFDPAKDLRPWRLLLPQSTYKLADESPYEVVLSGKTSATFPYDFPAMIEAGAIANSLFTISPQANEKLTDLAILALENEDLGKDQFTDFLCISYSTPDIAGHAFGPYSREMEDMYARLDRELQRLFSSLETRYGKDNFILFLTADHAVVPVPEMLVKMNLPGGYFFTKDRLQVLRDDYIMAYNADLLEFEINQNIYLDLKKIDSLHLDVDQVAEFTANELQKWPEIKTVLTKKQLMSGAPRTDYWGELLQNGFDPQRSGEVIFLLQPGYLSKEEDLPVAHLGTSHGSAFNYDTHVPLLWYGKGIPQGLDLYSPIQITDISATLVHMLNLQRPGSMTGAPILPLLPIKK